MRGPKVAVEAVTREITFGNEALVQVTNSPNFDGRDYSSYVVRLCDACQTVGRLGEHGFTPKLRTCARCRATLYCSEQCQKYHWNRCHKRECKSLVNAGYEEHGKRVMETLKQAFNDPLFALFLQIAIAFEADLFRRPNSSYPQPVLIKFMIEPTNMKQFLSMYRNPDKFVDSNKEMEGMLQIHKVFKIDRLDHNLIREAGTQLDMWGKERRLANSKGLEQSPIVNAFLLYGNCAFRGPILITPEAMTVAKTAFKITKVIELPNRPTIDMTDEPITHDLALEYLNYRIRTDDKNRWRLRCPMGKYDKDLILKAGKNPNADDMEAKLLKRKVEGEDIYGEPEMKAFFATGTHPSWDKVRPK